MSDLARFVCTCGRPHPSSDNTYTHVHIHTTFSACPGKCQSGRLSVCLPLCLPIFLSVCSSIHIRADIHKRKCHKQTIISCTTTRQFEIIPLPKCLANQLRTQTNAYTIHFGQPVCLSGSLRSDSVRIAPNSLWQTFCPKVSILDN